MNSKKLREASDQTLYRLLFLLTIGLSSSLNAFDTDVGEFLKRVQLIRETAAVKAPKIYSDFDHLSKEIPASVVERKVRDIREPLPEVLNSWKELRLLSARSDTVFEAYLPLSEYFRILSIELHRVSKAIARYLKSINASKDLGERISSDLVHRASKILNFDIIQNIYHYELIVKEFSEAGYMNKVDPEKLKENLQSARSGSERIFFAIEEILKSEKALSKQRLNQKIGSTYRLERELSQRERARIKALIDSQ